LIDGDPAWQRLAPAPFSTVCFRHRPAALAGHENEPAVARELDERNEALLERVNRSGKVYLSHTKLKGRYAIRFTLGNMRQHDSHVEQCRDALCRAAAGM
jgi:aromatic-L-amino-acid/L-tryptophan decarboxylase